MFKFKKLFCLIGNYLPPKLNCFFYKISGVNFDPNKVWIGNNCYLDTNFPENIIIKDHVCISFKVTICCHFNTSKSIKNHLIKKYRKNVIIEKGVFIGPGSIIMPGVVLKENTFIRAGSVITKSTKPNSIVSGNPQKEEKILNTRLASKINNLNQKYLF